MIMDFCWGIFVFFILMGALASLPALLQSIADAAEANEKAKKVAEQQRAQAAAANAAAEKDAEFQRAYPELWQARQLVALEQQRLEAQRQMAAEQLKVQQQLTAAQINIAHKNAEQKRLQENIGTGVTILDWFLRQ